MKGLMRVSIGFILCVVSYACFGQVAKFLRFKRLVIVLFLFLLNVSIASAATLFTTTASGSSVSWDSNIWTTTSGGSAVANLRPVLGDVVTINRNVTIGGASAFSTPVVSVTISSTKTLTIASNGTLNYSTLSISGTLNMNVGGSTLLGGNITNSNNLSVASGNTISVGDISNTGTLNFNSGSTITAGNITITSGTFNFNSLAMNAVSISNSGTIAVGGAGTINLTGNFTDNGGFNDTSGGAISFNGTSQSIEGSATINNVNISSGSTLTFNCDATINNIDVNSGATATLSNTGVVNLTGVLTISGTGTFDADGSGGTGVLTLISTSDDPTTDANIASLPSTNSVTGNVTFQRYMTPEGTNSRIYRYISSPVQNATVADLQNEIPVTGTFSTSSSCSGCVAANQSMWSYDESVAGSLNNGYVDFPATSNTEAFQPGVGYLIYVRGNVLPGGPTWDLTGEINSGPITLPVNYNSSGDILNDGWNIVGNPYPSTIDWDAGAWDKDNLEATIYFKDNGVVRSWTTGSGATNGGTNLIAPGQGFWVKATGAGTPSLIADEDVKVAGTSTTFFRESAPVNLMRVALTQGQKKDEMLIHFKQDASAGYDKGDAWKLKNSTVFNISSLAEGGEKFAVNALPAIDCSKAVKLDIQDVTPGNYQLNFSELETFGSNTSIILKDNFANTTVDVKANPSYSFDITSDASTFNSDRFSLIFSLPQVAPDLSLNASQPVCSGANGSIVVSGSHPGVNYMVLSNGQPVTDLVAGNGNELSFTILKDKLSIGENAFVIRSVLSTCSTSITEKTAVINIIEKPEVTPLDVVATCLEGSVTLTVSGAPVNGKYNWYVLAETLQPIAGQSQAIFVTPVLQKSETYYVAAVNELGCEGNRKSMVAEVITYDPVSIEQNVSGTLISSYAHGNKWFKNDEIISGVTGQEFLPLESGQYKVEVELDNGCTTISDVINYTAREQTVTAIGEDNHSVSVFPNPVDKILIVNLPLHYAVKESVIINSLGQEMGSIDFVREELFLKGQYDMMLKPSGLYFLKMRLSDGRAMRFNILKK